MTNSSAEKVKTTLTNPRVLYKQGLGVHTLYVPIHVRLYKMQYLSEKTPDTSIFLNLKVLYYRKSSQTRFEHIIFVSAGTGNRTWVVPPHKLKTCHLRHQVSSHLISLAGRISYDPIFMF